MKEGDVIAEGVAVGVAGTEEKIQQEGVYI